jgi:NDP-sugar pyrophosphorylase family protein
VTGGIHIRGVILAAGAGERVRPLTDHIPKALVNVAGRTLLDWVLQGFCFAGFQEITVAIGYKASMIEKHLESDMRQKKCEPSINIIPVQDFKLGPLRTTLTAIESYSDEEFFISPVDAIVESEVLTGMLKKYEKSKVMLLAVDFRAHSGTPVYVDKDGLIIGLGGSAPEGVFSVGRSVMQLIAHKSITDYCRTALLAGESRLVHVLNQMINDGFSISSYNVQSKWFDIDTLSDLILLNRYLLESRDTQNIKGGIFVPSGDLMEIGDRLALKESNVVMDNNILLEGPVFLSSGCRIGQNCRIGPNVTIGSHARISDSCELINSIVHCKSIVHANSRVENAIVYRSQIFSSR